MESLVLKTINFDVSVPTIVNFLERFVKAADCPESDHPKFEALSKVRKSFNFKTNPTLPVHQPGLFLQLMTWPQLFEGWIEIYLVNSIIHLFNN